MSELIHDKIKRSLHAAKVTAIATSSKIDQVDTELDAMDAGWSVTILGNLKDPTKVQIVMEN